MQLFDRALMAFGLVSVSSGLALAAPALTVTDLNLRAGPGTDTPVVITIPGGSTVDVSDCGPDGWCSVRYGRFAGFMNQAYLSTGGGPGYAPPPPPIVYAPTSPYPEYYWPPRWSWAWGGGWRRW